MPVQAIQYGESMKKSPKQPDKLEKHKSMLEALAKKQQNGAFHQEFMVKALQVVQRKKGFRLDDAQAGQFQAGSAPPLLIWMGSG